MKKFIATILIIAMVLSLGINIFLFKPKQVKAFLGIGDITIDIVNQLKDWILDQLPKTVARHMMIRLQQEIARWAQGGFSDENKPFAMTSWKQEVQEALNVASGRFVQEFNLTPLCAPIQLSLGTALGLNQYYNVPYTEYAACTIGNIVSNVEEFWKNPSIAMYGWDTWTALAQPQNNIYGSFLLAAARRAELESEEIAEKEKEIEVGQGYKSEAICNETDQEACLKTCLSSYPPLIGLAPNPDYIACESACEKSSIGVCLKKQTTKLGSEIKTSLDKVIGSDIDWLITADEITEMLNLVFSGLFTKLIHGTGLSVKPFYQAQTTVSKYQAQYGYQQQYKKAQTPEDLKKLRTDILNNILQSIKRVSTSSYECDKDYQLSSEVFQEVAAEILDQESQHLYTGVEGVDLKPDFEVLDSPQAVANGLAVYGETWNDIPFSRYPEKCSKIVNKKCSDIVFNLPYELDLNNINSECTTGCLGRINNYREEKNEEGERKFTDDEAISKAVADGKCSNYTIGNACLTGGKLISKTKNRCDECVTKAQVQCEIKTDPIEKQNCIELYCDNYEDISSSIVDARDFYNRCQLVAIKDSCNVCLKEYFMPASYCEEIYDYVNRSFVKYPGQFYEDLWWGGFNSFDTCANSRVDASSKIPAGLICRILPDINVYGVTCKTVCDVTDDELKDITDHKPSDADCGSPSTDAYLGAFHPGGEYIPYLVRKKAACCPALTGHEPEMYNKCRGITADTTAPACTGKSIEKEPWCYCKEGQRPLAFKHNGKPSYISTSGGPCANACSDTSFTVPKDMENIDKIEVYSNAAPGSSIMFIAKDGCKDPDFSTCIAGTGCDYVADGPSNVICEKETQNAKASVGHCTNKTGGGSTGETRFTCDLSAYRGQALTAGVYNNSSADGTTGAHVCIPCDPSDPGYPNYGTTYNQCIGKQ